MYTNLDTHGIQGVMNVPPQAFNGQTKAVETAIFSRHLNSPVYEHREFELDFGRSVAKNGYLWWYIDAISDDGQNALTLIVFVGSVFSPYYARARRNRLSSPEQHCAFNTILYGPNGQKRWSMTERSSQSLRRSKNHYALGPSELRWNGEALSANVNEWCVPFPRKMIGTIRVKPSAVTSHTILLDELGRHRWNPIAPMARVEVDFPGLNTSWSGDGYVDSNEGNEPLADGFVGWDWTRVRLHDDECAVRYETRPHQSQPKRFALSFDANGGIRETEPTDAKSMRSTNIWRIDRNIPSASGYDDRLERTLEDTPFYARSLISTARHGRHGQGFHESLCMRRFEQPWVQTLLPFRMPRVP